MIAFDAGLADQKLRLCGVGLVDNSDSRCFRLCDRSRLFPLIRLTRWNGTERGRQRFVAVAGSTSPATATIMFRPTNMRL